MAVTIIKEHNAQVEKVQYDNDAEETPERLIIATIINKRFYALITADCNIDDEKTTAVVTNTGPYFTDILVSANILGPVLRYLDRSAWNSLALCNKEIYNAAKLHSQPWPINFQLTRADDDVSRAKSYRRYPSTSAWSNPNINGTNRIAVNCNEFYKDIRDSIQGKIHIFDQRCGMMSKIGNNEQGYIEHGSGIQSLSFTHDDKLLISAGDDKGVNDNCCVKLWDNTTGNYELLQTWYVAKEIPDISYVKAAVSQGRNRYVAVLAGSYDGDYSYHILLKDIENNGITIKAVKLPSDFDYRILDSFSFLPDGRTILFCGGLGSDGDITAFWKPLDGGELIINRNTTGKGGKLGKLLVVSNDKKKLAAASEDGIKIYKIDTYLCDFVLEKKQSRLI
jgi:WD40 repeat protein